MASAKNEEGHGGTGSGALEGEDLCTEEWIRYYERGLMCRPHIVHMGAMRSGGEFRRLVRPPETRAASFAPASGPADVADRAGRARRRTPRAAPTTGRP